MQPHALEHHGHLANVGVVVIALIVADSGDEDDQAAFENGDVEMPGDGLAIGVGRRAAFFVAAVADNGVLLEYGVAGQPSFFDAV